MFIVGFNLSQSTEQPPEYNTIEKQTNKKLKMSEIIVQGS